jgi:putative addiction module killer protein
MLLASSIDVLTNCSQEATLDMVEVRTTKVFDDWYDNLRDVRVAARIDARVERLALGCLGDARPLGRGLFEMRVHIGPGYRIYFKWLPGRTVFLLLGGDKVTQGRDIERARNLALRLEEGC